MTSRKWIEALSPRPLPSVALARFITDIHHPLRSYHDPFPADQLLSVALIRQNVNELVHSTKAISGNVRLTELLSLFRGRQKSDVARVEATLASQYELAQWKSVFRDACAKEGTRTWLEAAIEDGEDVFFVVGYRTFVDAVLERGEQSNRERGIDFNVPVSAVVDANLMVPCMVSLAGTLDPGAGGSVQKAEREVQSFDVAGESVYAIQYCKVSFKWYSSKTVDKSFLGDTRWMVTWGVRGSEIIEDDVVEAIIVEGEDGGELAGDFEEEN
ncbi:hypothetical protein AA0119_g12107 [Alternaria tenuissima]|uniref:Uncharacterized protein n=1 Tax=Alternaria tenuissima TaxID=119927 RepID=A0ABY0FS88_9PLEO|nr:hypothetical protein AA0120_g12212 [Alternaria tenuissima]RYN88167.1 hypothetical protein AA0119_g12107 [Alternaria tenuissima]RYO05993.1 hypothetical protein AA0121_g12212 [Alternaria tenuissima]